MTFWEYAILFLSVLIGGGLAFYLKAHQKSLLSLVLSFSGAYLLGITVLHLMPGVFSGDSHNIGIWVLAGFLIQLLLEQLSRGVEHGHVHAHHHAPAAFAVQVMIGLCLHAFMEGLPLSGYEEFYTLKYHQELTHNHLLYGIILHKAPAAFALVILFLLSEFRKWVAALCLFIFASMSPLGALLAAYIGFEGQALTIVIAVVVGSFLHISTTILFESDKTHQHKTSWKKMAVMLAGMGIAFLTLI
jgi:zinc transporter ZupT